LARIAFIDVTATVSYGGVQTAVWKLAGMLARSGHEITVLGGDGSVRPSDFPVGVENIRVLTFPFLPRERVPDLGTRFRRIVERLSFARHARDAVIRGNFDWVILTKPFDFFWPWITPRSGTRFAFMSGGTSFFAGDRRLSGRIDAWLACSHFNAWQIQRRYKRFPTVIYNGVDTAQFAPGPSDRRERLGLPADATVLAFAGRLVGWKGLEVAICALAEPEIEGLPVRLLIIGDGPQRDRLADLARELGVEGRVALHPAVPHGELPALYAAADVGVFPSIADEAFGISVAEAMSCGKPVIASYIGGIPEVVGNEGSCGLLVSPGNPAEIAQAVRELAADPQKREAMGRAARSRVVAGLTWEASARRLWQGLQQSAPLPRQP
jgi:glycosyltransferase involved in cell wall biosynthesis